MINDQIRQLATRPDSKGPFVSLYIDTARSDEAQKDKIRLFLKNETGRLRETIGENGNGLEDAIRQIERYVENSLEPDTRGLAIFAAPKEQFFSPLQLPIAVRPELAIGSRPHIRQLAELRQAHPAAALAMVDAKSARLFLVNFGRIEFEVDLENPDTPKRHDQGGWSQSNIQRHLQENIDRHHQKVGEALTRIIDQGRVRGGVILSGQERNVANFRGFLSKRVDEKVIGVLHLDMHSSVEDVTAACSALIRGKARGEAMARVATLEGARGAVGFNRVVAALNERRVDSLFFTTRASARGWRCTSCRVLGLEVPLGCPVCGQQVRSCDLVEALILTAEADGATVNCIEDASTLDRFEGVGAGLRF
ncbi:MAG: Vms1/Ankzf1 family peptidyl-tRNA hydrolase [Thermoanaerobaculia bacterium]